MSHRFHPDPERDDALDAIVWDDCDDCTWHAELRDLDDDNARRAVELFAGSRPVVSIAEAQMVALLQRAYDVFKRGGLLDPGRLVVERVAQPGNNESVTE